MSLHCYQASQRPSMTTDRPPLPMSHTDSGIWPNISMCVKTCRCHVCIEQSKNYPTDAILPRKGPVTRTMSNKLQEDWARAVEKGPRVLMNLRVDF